MALDVTNGSIWKWEIPITSHFSLPMPKGARVLSVQMQNGAPVVWAEVSQDAAREARSFHVVGTGTPLPMGVSLKYVGTIQQGHYVWHLYEEVQARK